MAYGSGPTGRDGERARFWAARASRRRLGRGFDLGALGFSR